MRSDITPGQTSDYLGFDLIMDDNLPEPVSYTHLDVYKRQVGDFPTFRSKGFAH